MNIRFFWCVVTLCTIAIFSKGQTVLLEDFEGGVIPLGWTKTSNAIDGGWLFGTTADLSSSFFNIPEHTQAVATNDDACNCDKSLDYLITPYLDLSSYTAVYLSFEAYFERRSFSGDIEETYIEVSLDSGASWIPVDTLAGNVAWQKVIVDLSAFTNDTILVGFHYQDNGWLYGCAIDDVHIYQPDSLDASIISINIADIVTTGSHTVAGDLFNNGSQTITSMNLNWSVDGGPVNIDSLTSLSISFLATYNYSHATTWDAIVPGNYTLSVWASNLNGSIDQNTANDTFTGTVLIVDTIIPRLPMHEMFTSSTCGPCVPANINLDGILNAYPEQHVVLRYQVNWPLPGDPYYTDEVGERVAYYGISAAPWIFIDGGGIWNDNGNAYTQSNFMDAQAVPALMTITPTHTISGTTVNVNVEINPVTDFPSNDLVVHVVITESTTYNNVESNGETEFHDVMKKMLPDANGTSMGPLTKDATYSLNESYTFQGNYRLPNTASFPIDHTIEHSVEDFNNLEVLVFVQDNVTKQIHQAAWSKGTIIGIDDHEIKQGAFHIYPNPMDDRGFLSVINHKVITDPLKMVIYDLSGKKISEINIDPVEFSDQGIVELRIDRNGINSGMYIFDIQYTGTIYHGKIFIK